MLKAHRFRSTDEAGLLSLAKDLARVTADDIDAAGIQAMFPPPKGTSLRSLKSVEHMIATKVGDLEARRIMAPLVGIYELRHADAHLPSSDLDESFSRAGVDRSKPLVFQGFQLLDSCVSTVYKIAAVIKQFDPKTISS